MNVYLLTKFYLKINRKQIIGWCGSIASVLFLYMFLFPSVKDMAQIKMDAMPKELLQMFRMENFNDMSNYVTYFAMIYNMVLIAISIFAATFAAGILAKEERQKTIEFIYGLPITRTELYCAKMLTAVIAVGCVILCGMMPSVACGVWNGGETFVMLDVLKIIKLTSGTPFVFLFLGLMLSAVGRGASAASVGSMGVLFSYMLGFLAGLLGDDFEWVAYFSPFEMLCPENVLVLNGTTILFEFIYFAVMMVLFGMGLYQYRKRDFAI